MILMVDDDLPLARVYCQSLIHNGIPASYVGSGRDALEFLNNSAEMPSLIFVDIALPDIDGVALAKQLRSAGYGDRPIIGFSGAIELMDKEKTASAGFVAEVGKPLRLAELIEIAKRWTAPQPI